jgi:uncharacterized protein YozE (UPF0346 family)|nr:MAG TPA: YozE [Caudoviricetes sp.]
MQVNNQVTFKSWIAEFKGVDLPIGDYANDIARDKNFPDTEDLQKILDYLTFHNADIEMFEAIWDFYQRTK